VGAALHRRELSGNAAVHSVADLDEQERALLKVASTFQRVQSFGWVRFIVAAAALFHATIAVVLITFPYQQLLTKATGPAFALASPPVWAFLFAGAAVSLVALWAEPSQWFGWMVLFGTLLVGGAWFTTFFLAVVRDGSSPMALVLWLFLYGLFAPAIGARASGKR
jgi:tryptophan-rich sensory protein